MTGLGHLVAFIAALLASIVPTVSADYIAPISLFRIEPHATVLFGGDMMFDRSIRTTMEEKGGDFIFSCIDPTLQGSDMVVANLEGPITSTSSRSVGSKVGAPDNFTFTFPTSVAALLYAHHIRLVNLGNNHILNFGTDGVRSTTEALSAARVGYFGDPVSQYGAEGTIGSVAFAFINYNEFENHGLASTALQQIQEARAKGRVPIVYTHWGVEYETSAPAYVHTLAHRFVDAGAEIVIGSHPHVVEEHEVYVGKHIYYSLGNFIFDQYWDDVVSHGLLLQVAFNSSGVQSIKEIPVELGRDRRTCPTP